MFSTGNVLLCACFPHPPCSVGTALPVHSRDALFRPLPQPSPHSVPPAQQRSDAAEQLSLGGSPGNHPDRTFARLIIRGIAEGFRIGFCHFSTLQSAPPQLFNAVADALEWYLRDCGICQVFHYLDDFIIIGPPHSPECAEALAAIDRACSQLGVPITERDGPTTCLTLLGIEVDMVASQLRLPQEKLLRLRSLLDDWDDRKVCQRRELESLVRILNHACRVVRSGRMFLRHMLKGVRHHPVCPCPIKLNRSFRSDQTWWRLFSAKMELGVLSSFTASPSQLAHGVGFIGLRGLAQP